MALSPEARKRLESLNRGALAIPAEPSSVPTPDPPARAPSLAPPVAGTDWPFTGAEMEFPDFGHCLRVEQWALSLPMGWDTAPGRLKRAHAGYRGHHKELRRLCRAPLGSILFLDIETTGLSSTPLFLIGILHWQNEDFCVHQFLARSLQEERAVIRAAASQIEAAGGLVSFNGRSFDIPFIRNRSLHHQAPYEFSGPHVDVLLHARRNWRASVPNCRLQTLESHLLKREREGDVPGSLIPAVYQRYLRDGNPAPLVPILQHNLIDLVTTAELLTLLLEREPPAHASAA